MTDTLSVVPNSPLPALESDITLERVNKIFWASLIGHIRKEIPGPVENILDIGCHHGGLLEELATALRPRKLIGIEPSSHCRERSRFRLREFAPSVVMLPPERWDEIPAASINLITCHEVLHLVENISELFNQISRTLGVHGVAFVVAGCHSENPLWPRWKAQLQSEGQTVFDRTPFNILRAGIKVGLSSALRPLRRDGWIIYNPDEAEFTYSSVEELLSHQYRHKLLFRFVKQL